VKGHGVTLVNGVEANNIAVQDRGLAYGDGVFETIALRQGQVQLWQGHCERLAKGLTALGIIHHSSSLKPFVNTLANDVQRACGLYNDEHPGQDGVIKITVTRGIGGRGYLAPEETSPTSIVSVMPWPTGRETLPVSGVHAHLCQHPWSSNASLVGLKHLNRLDQVIARNEWQDTLIHEGLMLNSDGLVISGVMSNVFIERNGELITPLLNTSGIHGVMAQHIRNLAASINVTIHTQAITLLDVYNADGVFLTNSLNGIWPLVKLDTGNTWPITELTQNLQAKLDVSLEQQVQVVDLC